MTEVINYRELQRIPHKVLDDFIEESEEKKVIITIDNQYHYEIKKYDKKN